jgi:hypothetical protein
MHLLWSFCKKYAQRQNESPPGCSSVVLFLDKISSFEGNANSIHFQAIFPTVVYSKKSLIVTVAVAINVRDEEVDFLRVGIMVKPEREGEWTMKRIRQ